MATYSVKIDKNKIMVGMLRRAQKGDFEGVVDIVAALLVDENGEKPDHKTALEYIDNNISAAQLEDIATELQGAFTPKAN